MLVCVLPSFYHPPAFVIASALLRDCYTKRLKIPSLQKSLMGTYSHYLPPLPYEIFIHVLTYVDPANIFALRAVSTAWKAVIETEPVFSRSPSSICTLSDLRTISSLSGKIHFDLLAVQVNVCDHLARKEMSHLVSLSVPHFIIPLKAHRSSGC